MTQIEPDTGADVHLEAPSGDADLVAQGQALAKEIEETLAAVGRAITLEEMMDSLRGRSWSS